MKIIVSWNTTNFFTKGAPTQDASIICDNAVTECQCSLRCCRGGGGFG